jgi:predicted MFS family arabinose efflux permease
MTSEIEEALSPDPSPPPPADPPLPELTTVLLVLFPIGAGLVVCNLYYMQPLLPGVMHDFSVDETKAALLTTSTQVGYGLGMVFVLPVADIVEKRRLICVMLCLAVVFLVVMAVSPIYYVSLVDCFCIGFASVTPQLLVPIAAQMAKPERRGKVVGTVVSGILVGILLSRVLSGLIGKHFGWKTIFWIAAIMIGLFTIALRALLPEIRPSVDLTYFQALRSLPTIFLQYRDLRVCSGCVMCTFAVFNTFWTCLAYLLKDQWGWGSDIAGLFGLIGVLGALVANLGGRLVDRTGPFLVISIAVGVTLTAQILVTTVCWWIAGLIVTIVFLDMGIQAWHTSMHTIVQSLTNEARTRVTAIFMCMLFAGGSAGAAIGSSLYQHFGWTADGIFGIGLIAVGGALHFVARPGWRETKQEQKDAEMETELEAEPGAGSEV